jgi:hypothetical protein
MALLLTCACGDDLHPCAFISCPEAPTAHAADTLRSRDGTRELTITGDVVELGEADGTTKRYRFKETSALEDARYSECGLRPRAFGRRSFEIASATATTVVLRVRAQRGARFIDHTPAIARTHTSRVVPSTTTRADDGSFVDVTIDMSTSVEVELNWALEFSTSEQVSENITIRLGRECKGSCPRTPPLILLYGTECL